MKKLIIVNWRWKKETLRDTNEAKRYEMISANNQQKKIVISKIAKVDVFNEVIKEILVDSKESDECIVFTHYAVSKKEASISISENKIKIPEGFKGTLKIHKFSGGEDKIYFGVNNQDGLFDPDPESEEIKTENFDVIWDYYWNQFELEYQIKKLINTFLPLVIDMQGLSQIINKEKKEQYKQEIIQDLNLNGDRILVEWNELKKVLAIDSTQEVLSEEYRLNPNQKSKIKFPIERENSSFSKGELIKLFEKDSWLEDEFLPKWLEEAVEILEKKIEGKNN